jgi:hypothetical protein
MIFFPKCSSHYFSILSLGTLIGFNGLFLVTDEHFMPHFSAKFAANIQNIFLMPNPRDNALVNSKWYQTKLIRSHQNL